MLDFDFCSPTRFVFGRNAEKQTGALLKEYGANRVLFHFGGGSVKKSGLYDRIVSSIREAGLEFTELGGVKPNPADSLVYEGIRLCREKNIDFILAAGGGSVIDSAKAIALGSAADRDVRDFFTGKAVPEKSLPVGAVPTIAAAGSEGSNSCVISFDGGRLKRGCRSSLCRPRFAVMNPELTFTLPPFQTACGICDIMSHVLERYMSLTQGVSLTDRMCEAVLLAVIQNAPVVMENPRDYDARANIMWAGTVAHNQLLGMGRQEDWCVHALEHELSALYDIAHGAGLAVILPAYIRYQYQYNVPLFAELSERVFGAPYDRDCPERTVLEGIKRMTDFFRSLGLPVTFEELGARREDIPLLASRVKTDASGHSGSLHPLARKDFENVYLLACGHGSAG